MEGGKWEVCAYLAEYMATTETPNQGDFPIIDSMADARVEMLIDEATHRWNHSIIDGIFIPEEAELIKSIPLP